MAVKKKISVDNLNPSSIAKICRELAAMDTDNPYRIYIADNKELKTRTIKLNKYYWGVVIDTVANRTGYEPEELHEMFKKKFALKTRFSLNGFKTDTIVEEFPQSTKMMSNVEFINYYEKIRRWFAEIFKENIPLPNEMTEEQMINAYER